MILVFFVVINACFSALLLSRLKKEDIVVPQQAQIQNGVQDSESSWWLV